MKFKVLSIAVLALIFNSCSKTVEAPDDSTEINNLSTARKAIMFKFTGVNCGACTAYHPIYEDFLAANRGKVIGLHVHCGVDDTLNTNFSLWFTNEYDIPGTPRFSEGSIMKQDTAFDVADSLALITMDKKADIGVGISHTVVGNTLAIKAKTQCFKDLSGEYNMAVYVVENNCWADQIGAGNIQHNRVLRGKAHTDMWGVPLTALTKGAPTDHSFTYNLGTIGMEYWTAANLEVVVVIYKMVGGEPVEVMNCNSTLDQ